jgi:hypothetical protein
MKEWRIQTPSLQCTTDTAVLFKKKISHLIFSLILPLGRKMAKFAAINVHKRLVTEEAYRDKRYAEALKRAFLGTDEDFLAGWFRIFLPFGCPYI